MGLALGARGAEHLVRVRIRGRVRVRVRVRVAVSNWRAGSLAPGWG